MKYIFPVIALVLLYIFFFITLNNYSLIFTTLTSDFPIHVKTELLLSLFTGIGTTMTTLNLLTLGVIALLTAVNIVLIYKRMLTMRTYGSVNFVVGGSSLLGLASSGCASCGLPLLAFFGLGSSVGLLPLKGYEFSIVTIGLLIISCVILVKQLHKPQVCALPEKEYKKRINHEEE